MNLVGKFKTKSKHFFDNLFGENENTIFDDSQKHSHIEEKENILSNEQAGNGIDNEEGQLALDVFHTKDDVVIKAPIAGVTLQDISITVADGILTVRGARKKDDQISMSDYYLQECYWGSFSRSVVLPNNLKTEEIKAYFKSGILKISIPKEDHIKIKSIPISAVEEAKVTLNN